MTIFCGEREVKLKVADKLKDGEVTGLYEAGVLTIAVGDREAWDVIGSICHELLHLLDHDGAINLSHQQIYDLSNRLRLFHAQNEGSRQDENDR